MISTILVLVDEHEELSCAFKINHLATTNAAWRGSRLFSDKHDSHVSAQKKLHHPPFLATSCLVDSQRYTEDSSRTGVEVFAVYRGVYAHRSIT